MLTTGVAFFIKYDVCFSIAWLTAAQDAMENLMERVDKEISEDI
jgi:hypothetical protein